MAKEEKTKKTPVGKYKRTKIIATLGPTSIEKETIKDLINAGANGLRLNFAYSDYEQHAETIQHIREVSSELNKPVAIIADLQGPKIRVGDLPQQVEIAEGSEIKLAEDADFEESGIIPTQIDLSQFVSKGERLLMADGSIEAEVKAVQGKVIVAQVKNGGTLVQHNGINLPDTNFSDRGITEKDSRDVDFALEHGVDYLALSFVQTTKDIEPYREQVEAADSQIKLIAKIETKAAVDNLESIVLASDGVMVARGDLAVEAGSEAVPIIQRKIISLSIEYGKVAIVATQMLASMQEKPKPTRAEVSDVATAVIVGADAVMLSEETAIGSYPVKSVAMMKRIIRYTEDNSPVEPLFMHEEDHSIQSAISSGIMTLAHQVQAKVIVAETRSGRTARNIAAHRPSIPIIMVTDNKCVAYQLAIVYGGKSYYFEDAAKAGQQAIEVLKDKGVLQEGDIIVRASGRQPGVSGGTDTIKVRVIE